MTTAAAKDADLAKKRTGEISVTLRDSSLTPAAYIDTAFNFPEVERIEIHTFTNAWQPKKIEELEPGFDADCIESYLLGKHGPARFRFAAIVGRKSFAWRTYTLGDVKDEPAAVNGANGDGTAVTTDEAMRGITDHLKKSYSAAQLSDLLADLETRRLNREQAPTKLMFEMMGPLLTRLGAPNPGNDRVIDLLIAELKDMRQELRDTRQQAATAAAPAAVPARTGVAQIAEDIKAVMSAGELLGLQRPDGKPPAASPWTPDVIKTAIDAASPVLNRFADLIQLRMTQGTPAALPPGGTPVATDPKTPPPAPNPVIKDQFVLLMESLRSRDWKTVAAALAMLFPEQEFDPDVNVLLYVNGFKMALAGSHLADLQPRVDDLRGEMAEFLKWLRETRSGETPA